MMSSEKMAEMGEFFLYKDKYPIPADHSRKEFIEELEEMTLRDDDIFIATYPRSGTHWMQEIVQLILVDGHLENITAKERRVVLELADVESCDMVDQVGPGLRQMKDVPSPRVMTTHLPSEILPKQFNERKCKLIYVYRNPKDAITSYYHFSRKFFAMSAKRIVPHSKETFERFFDAMISGKYEYGSWFDHIEGYNQRKDEANVLFVSFESLKEDIKMVVRNVASFLCRPLDEDGVQRVAEGVSFDKMRESFREDETQNIKDGKKLIDRKIFLNRGETNQWKELFTQEQSDRLNHLLKEKAKRCKLMSIYS